MIISLIAAASKNRVIGAKNRLPWHLPEDLKFFRQKTLNHICIMGRKTFESVGSKPLPHRMCVIVTRKQGFDAPGCHVFHSLDEALDFAKMQTEISNEWGDEVFVCGGADIYAQAINKANKVYLTLIDQEFEGDVHFPKMDTNVWDLVEKIDNDGPISFSFCTFVRK